MGLVRPYDRAVRRTWSAIVLALVLVVAACGGSDEEASVFCQRSADYIQFETGLADAAGDPAATEAFMTVWKLRLDELLEVAPQNIEADITQIRDGVADIDTRLSNVDYDVLQLTFADLDTPETNVASGRFIEYIGAECEIGPEAVDPNAPPPLTDDELDDLVVDTPDQGNFEDLIAEELQTSLGLTVEQSACLAESVDNETLARLVSGQSLTEDANAGFLSAVEACGIDAGVLAGGQ